MNDNSLKIKKRGEDGNKVISVRIKESILDELDRIAYTLYIIYYFSVRFSIIYRGRFFVSI